MKFHFYLGHRNPKAYVAFEKLTKRYDQTSIQKADVAVVLSGDGGLLTFLNTYIHTLLPPVYGLNYGDFGFMLNKPPATFDGFETLVEQAIPSHHHPLKIIAIGKHGEEHRDFAFNDIVIRNPDPAKALDLSATLSGQNISRFFRGDGLIVSAPLGATGYNASAYGQMPRFGENCTMITPLATMPLIGKPFAPIKAAPAQIDVIVLTPQHRPARLTADNRTLTQNLVSAKIWQDTTRTVTLLHKKTYPLRKKYKRAVAKIMRARAT